jgi:hypothetical protein
LTRKSIGSKAESVAHEKVSPVSGSLCFCVFMCVCECVCVCVCERERERERGRKSQ